MDLKFDSNVDKTSEKVLAVVPVYNGQPSMVIKVVYSLLSQDYRHLRVLVIDDGSERSLFGILRKEFESYPQLSLIRNEKNIGFANSLNKSLSYIDDEKYLMVLEQDCELLDKDYVRRSITYFSEDKVGVVSGENVPQSCEQLPLIKRVFVSHLCENIHDSEVVRVGFSLLKADVFRVDVLKMVGGFESSARWKFACEEHLISYKIRSAGFDILKNSDLRFRAYWGQQEKLIQNLQKEALYGRGLGWALARMRSDLEIGDSEQLRSKMLTRVVQAQYVALTILSVFLLPFYLLPALILIIATGFLHFVYLAYRSRFFFKAGEKMLFISTGFLRSWVYIPNFFFGFMYGFLLRGRENQASC